MNREGRVTGSVHRFGPDIQGRRVGRKARCRVQPGAIGAVGCTRTVCTARWCPRSDRRRRPLQGAGGATSPGVIAPRLGHESIEAETLIVLALDAPPTLARTLRSTNDRVDDLDLP